MTHPIIQLQLDKAKAAIQSARAYEIADELIGTCKSLHEVMTQAETDDDALRAELNDLCFECDCCGWWASTDELNNDGELEDCDEACDECVQYGGDT